jgi:hypothetical protein
MRGTGITARDYWNALKGPLLSGVTMAAAGCVIKIVSERVLSPGPRLLVELGLSLAAYAWVLLVVMGQRHVYVDLLIQIFKRTRPVLAEV